MSRIEDPKADKIRDAVIDALGLAVFAVQKNTLGSTGYVYHVKPWYEGAAMMIEEQHDGEMLASFEDWRTEVEPLTRRR